MQLTLLAAYQPGQENEMSFVLRTNDIIKIGNHRDYNKIKEPDHCVAYNCSRKLNYCQENQDRHIYPMFQGGNTNNWDEEPHKLS